LFDICFSGVWIRERRTSWKYLRIFVLSGDLASADVDFPWLKFESSVGENDIGFRVGEALLKQILPEEGFPSQPSTDQERVSLSTSVFQPEVPLVRCEFSLISLSSEITVCAREVASVGHINGDHTLLGKPEETDAQKVLDLPSNSLMT